MSQTPNYQTAIADDPEAVVAFEQAIARGPGGPNNPEGVGGKGGKASSSIDNDNNVNSDNGRCSPVGNSAAAAIRRLAKDRPATPGRYCPACLSEEVITDYTRQTPRGTLRRKHCKDCGHVFSTMECLVGAQIPPIAGTLLLEMLELAGVAIEWPAGFRKT